MLCFKSSVEAGATKDNFYVKFSIWIFWYSYFLYQCMCEWGEDVILNQILSKIFYHTFNHTFRKFGRFNFLIDDRILIDGYLRMWIKWIQSPWRPVKRRNAICHRFKVTWSLCRSNTSVILKRYLNTAFNCIAVLTQGALYGCSESE